MAHFVEAQLSIFFFFTYNLACSIPIIKQNVIHSGRTYIKLHSCIHIRHVKQSHIHKYYQLLKQHSNNTHVQCCVKQYATVNWELNIHHNTKLLTSQLHLISYHCKGQPYMFCINMIDLQENCSSASPVGQCI